MKERWVVNVKWLTGHPKHKQVLDQKAVFQTDVVSSAMSHSGAENKLFYFFFWCSTYFFLLREVQEIQRQRDQRLFIFSESMSNSERRRIDVGVSTSATWQSRERFLRIRGDGAANASEVQIYLHWWGLYICKCQKPNVITMATSRKRLPLLVKNGSLRGNRNPDPAIQENTRGKKLSD